MAEEISFKEFLEAYDDRHIEVLSGNERALRALLRQYQDHIPPVDERFHKTFRKVDVVNDGVDTAIWYLLQDAPVFWDVYAKLTAVDNTRPLD